MSERLAIEQKYTIGRMGVKIPAIDRYITNNVSDSRKKFPDGNNVSSFIIDMLRLNGMEPDFGGNELAIPATDNKPAVIIRSTHPQHQILTVPETPGELIEVLGYHGGKWHTIEDNGTIVGSTYFRGKNLAIHKHDLEEYRLGLFEDSDTRMHLDEAEDTVGLYFQASLQEALEETVKLLS